jgi:phosphatidate phosphatase APP1
VRREGEAGGIVIEPYRGYGSRYELFLMGRVFRQASAPLTHAAADSPESAPSRGRSRRRPQRRLQRRPQESTLLADLKASLRRLLRRGARGEIVRARYADVEESVETDRDGYFRLHMTLPEPPPADRLWHRVSLSVTLPSGGEAQASADVFVPPESARFVVISDIDDTVMHTGVASRAKTFWRLFAQPAESRAAFPGVAALYRALHGAEQNPMLYVSRSPWSIYPMLETFFRLHRIPVGPVLFLREWGISFRRLAPRRAPEHKLELIRKMLALYRDWPFVLIGDSGQHDPETYAQIVREHEGRVVAVYIRNVSRDPTRHAAIDGLAQQVLEAGSTLLLAADSIAIAEHAAERGLIQRDAVAEVTKESLAESDDAIARNVRTVRHRTAEQTQDAVARGELEEALESSGDEPPSTLVESGTANSNNRIGRQE